MPLCLISRPLASLNRQTQTDTDILPPRPAKAKESIATRYYQHYCPKGLKFFARAGLPGRSLVRRLVAQVKKLLSAFCLCVSAAKIFYCFPYITGTTYHFKQVILRQEICGFFRVAGAGRRFARGRSLHPK